MKFGAGSQLGEIQRAIGGDQNLRIPWHGRGIPVGHGLSLHLKGWRLDASIQTGRDLHPIKPAQTRSESKDIGCPQPRGLQRTKESNATRPPDKLSRQGGIHDQRRLHSRHSHLIRGDDGVLEDHLKTGTWLDFTCGHSQLHPLRQIGSRPTPTPEGTPDQQ